MKYRLSIALILIVLLTGVHSSRAGEPLNEHNFSILCASNGYAKAKACAGATRYRELMTQLEARARRAGKARRDHRYVCAALCGMSDAENQLQAQPLVSTGNSLEATFRHLTGRCDFSWQYLFRDYAVSFTGNRIDVGPAGDVTADTACFENLSSRDIGIDESC